MTWTNPIPVAFPTSLLAEANRLAHIIDPDTGGALTFSAERTRGGYFYAEIPFVEEFLPLVQRRDPDEWFAAMSQLAQARGREPLSEIEIETLCSTMKLNDEVPDEFSPD